MRRFAIVAALATMLFATSALAQDYPKPFVQRPVVKEAMHGEAGLTANLSYLKDVISFGDNLNLSVFGLFSPMEKLEVGLQVPLNVLCGGESCPDILTTIGPLHVKYQVLDFLAAYLDFTIPVKDFDAKMISFELGAELKYLVMPELAIVGLLGFNANFGFDYKTIPLMIGAFYNIMPALWAGLMTGADFNTDDFGNPVVPVVVEVGYTISNAVDLALDFGLTDVKGSKADAMAIMFRAAYLF